MNSEIEKILTMVQEGKIDAEKGSELIQVLNDRNANETVVKKATKYSDKTLKIRVNSDKEGNVSVNLPIKLIKVLLNAGVSIAANIPESEKYVKDVDFNLVMEAIENEIDGPIVEVKASNGDTVIITIE